MTLVVRESTGAPRTAVQNDRGTAERADSVANPIDNVCRWWYKAAVSWNRFHEWSPAVWPRCLARLEMEPVPASGPPSGETIRSGHCRKRASM